MIVAPLDGLVVVELATVLMAPYASQMLGDLGADVIKVESGHLDASRVMGRGPHPQLSGIALNLHRNKRSIQLDLRQPDGLTAIGRLLTKADVFITNLRPSALTRLSLHYDAVKNGRPSLIYCESHGFRASSPEGERPAFDDIIQAETGVPQLPTAIGEPVHFAPMLLADKLVGVMICNAVLAALVGRSASGAGGHIEVPMFDALLAFNLVEHMAGATVAGGDAGYSRILTHHRGPHRTVDGYVALLPYSDENWKALYQAVGREDELELPWFRDRPTRNLNADKVYASLADVVSQRTTSEWLQICGDLNVPVAPVPSLGEIIADPKLHRGAIEELVHPVAGPYRSIVPAAKFDGCDTPVRRPAPLVGQHTIEVLTDVGYTAAEISGMLDRGAATQSDG